MELWKKYEWVYRFWDLLSFPLKACANSQEERPTSAIMHFRDGNSKDKNSNC